MAYAKRKAGFVKRVGRAIKRRYFRGKGYRNPKINQMAKDVMFLKRMVNPEKKRWNTNTLGGTLSVGQVNGNSSGDYAVDMTPAPNVGTAYDQRVGNSIKYQAAHYAFQFKHMSSTEQKVRLKICFYRNMGVATSASAIDGQVLLANPFVTGGSVYDFCSSRNPDYFKTYRLVKTKYVTLDQDDFTSQAVIKTVTFGIRWGHHIKWNAAGSNSEGQVLMSIVADSGNRSTNTTCTLTNGVPIQGTNTGVQFNYNITHYYTDD